MEFIEKIKKVILDFFNGDPESEKYINDALSGMEPLPDMPIPSEFCCLDKSDSWFFTEEASAFYEQAEGYEQKSMILASYLRKISDSAHDNDYLIRIAFVLVNISERLKVNYRELFSSSSKFMFAIDEYLKSEIKGDKDIETIVAKRRLCARFIYALRHGALEKPDKEFIENDALYMYYETCIMDPRIFAFNSENEDIEYLQMLMLMLSESAEERSFDELLKFYEAGIGG